MLTRDSILEGDCTRILKALQTECVDFILTDPPYLVNYRDRTARDRHDDSPDQVCSETSPTSIAF